MQEISIHPTPSQSTRPACDEPPPRRAHKRSALPTWVYLSAITERRPTLILPVNGRVATIQLERQSSQVDYQEHGKARGNVRDFSHKSRRRLMRYMASINLEAAGLPTFITLTYPGIWHKDPERWKKQLHTFTVALFRKWPAAWGIWRLEFQKRGAPHYHMLLWDGPTVEAKEARRQNGKMCMLAIPGNKSWKNRQVFEWLSNTWFRVVGSGDEKHRQAGTRIEPVVSANGVMAYAAKYLAKSTEEQTETFEGGTGRHWARIGEKRWMVEEYTQDLTGPQALKMRRVMRKMIEAKTGKRQRFAGQVNSCFCFMREQTALKLQSWAWDATGGIPF